jgi:predicted Zn-dependent peptidase
VPVLWLALSAYASDPAAELVTHPTVSTLPNGLIVILEENHRTDTVALHLTYGVGSRDEKPGEIGCAHLFEHLMFEGSEHVPSNKFDEWLTVAGGDNNAYTSEDVTAYHMTFPSGALDLGLFLESDRMGYLLAGVTDEAVANQRKVVLQERAEGYAEPNGRDWDALTRLTWPEDHPYHHPVIGTVADIEGFTAAGTRAFWKAHYRPSNGVLAVVGNFDSAAALAAITSWFSDVPETEGKSERLGAFVPGTKWAPANGYIEDDVEERTIYLAWRTVPIGHKDEPALDILERVLSGGRGTRIDDRLYFESTKATSVFAYHAVSEIGGMFILAASSPDTSLEKLGKLLGQEAGYIPQSPPTAAELERARESIRTDWLDALEDPASRAELLVECQRSTGRPDCLVDEWKRYAAVTADDVARVERTYLDPETVVSLSVVPRGDKLYLLGATPVELP